MNVQYPPMNKRVNFGLKVVTRDNWLSPDPAAMMTSQVPPGYGSEMAGLIAVGNYFTERFAQISLSSRISEEVARLFAVATGTVVYAVFYYPLLEIGLERAYAAVEAATREATASHGGRASVKDNHAGRIDWLCREGWIDAELCLNLHGTREMRNAAKHERQQIVMPVTTARTLHFIAQDLERLAQIRDDAAPRFKVSDVEHEHRKYPWA